MTEYFIWDEISEGLALVRTSDAPNYEQAKGRKRLAPIVHTSKIYSPHSYLILNFHESLNPSEKMKFRKYYLRKVSPNEPNVIILQDIKDLVIFLLITPVSPQFINFFHLPIVDRFLRGLILYFQYYTEIWDKVMQERTATIKKAPNPLAGGHRVKYSNELHTLRCMLGREYADLIIGCQDTVNYHHMVSGKKKTSTLTQSQGEKDLRIFEVLINIAHRVVWIALHRKYFHLIEVELHRLFRTEAYNTAERKSDGSIIQDMLENDILLLHGSQLQEKRKLLRSSPLIDELIYSDYDFRILSLGIMDIEINDPRIIYLHKALLIEEEKLLEFGIKIGILGQKRSNYDIMLMLHDEEKSNDVKSEIKIYEREGSTTSDIIDENLERVYSITRMPDFGPDLKLITEFPCDPIIDISPKGYHKVRKEAKKRWIVREIKRHDSKLQSDIHDTYSLISNF